MSQDWDGCYVRGETPWDKGAPSPGLVDYLEGNALRGRVLVPGCGTGHDVRALAGAGAEAVGLDISPSAIARAEAFEKSGRESYLLGDLFALEDEWRAAFDWVWEHTCFCAIEPGLRSAYAEAVAGTLRPGGKLLGVFYLDPYDEEHQPGEGPPHGCTLEEIEGLFGEVFEILESWRPERAYAGREGRERMLQMAKKD